MRAENPSTVIPPSFYKELDWIAGGIVDQDLAAASTGDDLAPEAGPGSAQGCDLALEVRDADLDAIPAPGLRPAAVWYERRGLAERRRDPSDRRAYTLYLTAPGRKLLVELERAADEDEVELLAALDAPERRQLVSLLQRVAESLGLAAGVHPNLEPR